MSPKSLLMLVVMSGTILTAACAPVSPSPTPAAIPNPASVYCIENGGQLDLRTDASGGVAGFCVFPDGSECEEWAFMKGECKAEGVSPTETADSLPAEYPTPWPIDPQDYQGWWTYTHAGYGFSLMLPPDWEAVEITGDPLLEGHLLILRSAQEQGLEIRMTFRRSGDEVLLWPTGIGQGDFIPQGTLDVAGLAARRVLFVCPAGQVNQIWYHGAAETEPNLVYGDMEFSFIFSLGGNHCESTQNLEGKAQYAGEMIIASLQVPR